LARRFLLTGVLAALVSVAMPGIAQAAPAKGFGLQFECSDGQSVFLVAPPGHAVFVPGIAVGLGGVFKPVAFHVVNTITGAPSGNGTTSSDFVLANATVGAQNPNVSVSCFNDSTYTLDGGGTLEQAITMTGFFTGHS